MPLTSDLFDLGALRLTSGEARRLELHVTIDAYVLGGERYSVEPAMVPARLDISRITGNGYVLRLRFAAGLSGPCTRCLQTAAPSYDVDAREISLSGASEELSSPYVEHRVLDLRGWARDALALALPAKVLCGADCAGLCPVCGEDLNAAGPAHEHDRAPDPRWAKLSELRFE